MNEFIDWVRIFSVVMDFRCVMQTSNSLNARGTKRTAIVATKSVRSSVHLIHHQKIVHFKVVIYHGLKMAFLWNLKWQDNSFLPDNTYRSFVFDSIHFLSFDYFVCRSSFPHHFLFLAPQIVKRKKSISIFFELQKMVSIIVKRKCTVRVAFFLLFLAFRLIAQDTHTHTHTLGTATSYAMADDNETKLIRLSYIMNVVYFATASVQ